MERLRSGHRQQDSEVPLGRRAPRLPRWAHAVIWAGLLAGAYALGSTLPFELRREAPPDSPSIVTEIAEASVEELSLPSPDALSEQQYAGQNLELVDFVTRAKELMKARDYPQARVALENCLVAQPLGVDCHKLLGTVWAKLGESDRGAASYRLFLKYAPPSHPDFEKVLAILEQYKRRH